MKIFLLILSFGIPSATFAQEMLDPQVQMEMLDQAKKSITKKCKKPNKLVFPTTAQVHDGLYRMVDREDDESGTNSFKYEYSPLMTGPALCVGKKRSSVIQWTVRTTYDASGKLVVDPFIHADCILGST